MTQDDAFKILTMGKNVFLTGSAGSGKTYLLNKYIDWLRMRGIDPAITASTGIAATHIGGQTIHSWSGIGIKKKFTEYDLDRIEQNEKLVKRFRKTQVLIIDEISMLSANTLHMVNQAVQAGLQTHEPFGGIQVIFCGDFFQLPPIAKNGNKTRFAFESNIWKELSLHTCYLTEQYRQDDENLLKLLNGIREGLVPKEIRQMLEKRIGIESPKDIPHLYTHNVNVDELNNEKLSLISEPAKIFKMKTKGSKARIETLKKGILVPENLTLKKGASVMFVKNHPHGIYVNGTLGTVVDFSSQGPIVKTIEGESIEVEPESWKMEDVDKVLAEVIQIPLRMAWAVTVHKSQGITLDSAYIDLTKTFVPGQGYVALSRVKSFDGLYLKGMSELAYSVHPAVSNMNNTFLNNSKHLERRLQSTPNERLKEISDKFVFESGGHEPRKGIKNIKNKVQKLNTYQKTKILIEKETSIYDIAKIRKITEETVISHIEKMLTKNTISREDIEYIHYTLETEENDFEKIATAFAKTKKWTLTQVRKELKDKYSYNELRLARLFLRPWGKE